MKIKLYSADEAAEHLNLDKSYFIKLVKQYDIPYDILGKQNMVFHVSSLELLRERRKERTYKKKGGQSRE